VLFGCKVWFSSKNKDIPRHLNNVERVKSVYLIMALSFKNW